MPAAAALANEFVEAASDGNLKKLDILLRACSSVPDLLDAAPPPCKITALSAAVIHGRVSTGMCSQFDGLYVCTSSCLCSPSDASHNQVSRAPSD